MPIEHHKKFLRNNITKTYKKRHQNFGKSVNLEEKNIAKYVHLDDQIEQIAKADVLSTLMDHKKCLTYNFTLNQ